MLEQNREEFEVLNILKWWGKGYKGKGIKVANLESVNMLDSYKGTVKVPFEYNLKDSPNIHGQTTMDVINQVAPEATKYSLSNGTTRFVEDSMPFIIDNKVHLVNASLGGSTSKDDFIAKCVANGTIFVTASGNGGSGGTLRGYAKSPHWLAVGAVHNPVNPTRANYSTPGDELFSMSFSNLYVTDGRNEEKSIPMMGTSFSSPLFTGMLALVQQFFLENTGSTLHKDGIEVFVRDNVVDMGDPGHDTYYGHGLFVLPDPDSINIPKYKPYLIDYTDEKAEPIPEPKPEPITEEDDTMYFTDTMGRYSEGAIDHVKEKGLMNGYPDGSFQPNKPVSREELAMVLARMTGYVEKK